jgi:short-subunit dehydrogenase
VVTGASSGLGAIFAQRLGERGFNLLLTGRHPDRLEHVRQRVIANARDCAITLLTADLATGDGVLALLHELGDRPVDLLVNNAGLEPTASSTDPTPREKWTSSALTSPPWSGSPGPSCPA